MNALSLVASSRAILTRTTVTINPNDATDKITASYNCDLLGNPLPLGAGPILLYRDLFTGKTFARVAEVMPTGTASVDVATATAIKALNPVHYCSEDSNVRGWFVPAPDFNSREQMYPATQVAA